MEPRPHQAIATAIARSTRRALAASARGSKPQRMFNGSFLQDAKTAPAVRLA